MRSMARAALALVISSRAAAPAGSGQGRSGGLPGTGPGSGYPHLGEGTPSLASMVSVTLSYLAVAIYSETPAIFRSIATRSHHRECAGLLLAPRKWQEYFGT
jgi:hypothetical protein